MKRTMLFGLVLATILALFPVAGPAHAAEAASPSYGGQVCTYYWVKPGDTLSGIAQRYGMNMWTLAQRNGISNPNRIYVGQRLVISCHTPPPPPKPQPPKPQPPYYPPPPQPGDNTYPPGPCTPSCGNQPPPPPPPPVQCNIQPVQGFSKVWNNNPQVRQRLGCPTQPEQGFQAMQQFFRNGYVVQDLSNGQIIALYSNGRWEVYADTWTSSDPVYNPALIAPPGWCQPEYGIGKVWRNVDDVSQRLGWARWPQSPVSATRQQYEHGWMLWTSSQGVYVLYEDGTYQLFK